MTFTIIYESLDFGGKKWVNSGVIFIDLWLILDPESGQKVESEKNEVKKVKNSKKWLFWL